MSYIERMKMDDPDWNVLLDLFVALEKLRLADYKDTEYILEKLLLI